MPLTKPLSEVKKDVNDFVASAELLKGLQYLQGLLPESSPKRAQTIELAGRLNEANTEYNGGRIEFKDKDLVSNQVSKGITDLLKDLTDADFDPVSSPVGQVPSSNVPKFVVIYHELDKPQFDMLDKHWSVLTIMEKIRVYDVNETSGAELLPNAEKEIADADYLLVIVTANLFNRNPGWFKLVIKAITDGRRVIPLRIGDVSFEGLGLEKFKSLPSMGRAVSNFPNQDAAYADIVGELRKLLPK